MLYLTKQIIIAKYKKIIIIKITDLKIANFLRMNKRIIQSYL